MASNIKVGDRVQWTHRRTIYKGFELTLREGTVAKVDDRGATIKPDKKYARHQWVYLSRLTIITPKEANHVDR